jgi:hypothetical protein
VLDPSLGAWRAVAADLRRDLIALEMAINTTAPGSPGWRSAAVLDHAQRTLAGRWARCCHSA